MKPSLITPLLLAVILAPVVRASDEEPGFTSRLSLSPRVGFNISARFEGVGGEGTSRFTPNGDAYNYDDGYVLTDISGNAGGQTWYWGYDDSTAQLAGNTILLNRSTISGGPGSLTQDADLSAGAELCYQLRLGSNGRWRHGLEAGAAYQNVHVLASGGSRVTVTTETDAYPFTAGSTPPNATPASPYQGTYEGPGFTIGSIPSASSMVTIPDVLFSTENELRSTLWDFRIGPYLEYQISKRVSLAVSVGVAAGVLDAEVTWSDTADAVHASGSGTDLGILMGFYGGGTVSWQFARRWSLLGGVQYQNLGTYQHTFDRRTLQLDFNQALFASLGIGWSF